MDTEESISSPGVRRISRRSTSPYNPSPFSVRKTVLILSFPSASFCIRLKASSTVVFLSRRIKSSDIMEPTSSEEYLRRFWNSLPESSRIIILLSLSKRESRAVAFSSSIIDMTELSFFVLISWNHSKGVPEASSISAHFLSLNTLHAFSLSSLSRLDILINRSSFESLFSSFLKANGEMIVFFTASSCSLSFFLICSSYPSEQTECQSMFRTDITCSLLLPGSPSMTILLIIIFLRITHLYG